METQPGGSVDPSHDAMLAVVKAMADSTRLQVLGALAGRERSVSDLAGLVEANVAAVSQHLARLRAAGLVASRRDGTRIFYRLANGHVKDLLDEIVLVTAHVAGELDLPSRSGAATGPQGDAATEAAPRPTRRRMRVRSRTGAAQV